MKQLPLSERLRAAIREKILRGEYRPGSLFVEADLALEHGVSKTPVREALQILAAEGLITVLPKKGYMVRTMDFKDVREIMDMRMLLEPFAAEAATAAADPELPKRLTEILDEQRSLQDRPLEAMGAARQFHTELASAGGNQRICDALEQMFYESARAHHTLPAMQQYMSRDQELIEHQAILDAVVSGDPGRAAEAMRQHLATINVEMGTAAFGTSSLWQ